MSVPHLFEVPAFQAYMRISDDEFELASAELYLELGHEAAFEAVGEAWPAKARVRAIVFEVCARGYRNAIDTVSETTDDYTYRRRENVVATSGVALTDAERDELLSLAGTAREGRGSVRLNAPWSAWS
jgi:hypothetical protein